MQALILNPAFQSNEIIFSLEIFFFKNLIISPVAKPHIFDEACIEVCTKFFYVPIPPRCALSESE